MCLSRWRHWKWRTLYTTLHQRNKGGTGTAQRCPLLTDCFSSHRPLTTGQFDCTIARLWNYTIMLCRYKLPHVQRAFSHCEMRWSAQQKRLSVELRYCNLRFDFLFLVLPLSVVFFLNVYVHVQIRWKERKGVGRQCRWWWWLVSIETSSLWMHHDQVILFSWDSLILICKKICGQL